MEEIVSSCPVRQWACTLERMSHTRQAAGGKGGVGMWLSAAMAAAARDSVQRTDQVPAKHSPPPLQAPGRPVRGKQGRTCVAAPGHEDVDGWVLRQAVHPREVAVVVADDLRYSGPEQDDAGGQPLEPVVLLQGYAPGQWAFTQHASQRPP